MNQIKVIINQLVNSKVKVNRNPSNLLEESPVAKNSYNDNDLQNKESDHAGLSKSFKG